MTRLSYLLKQYKNILGWYDKSEDKAKYLVTINTLIVGATNGLVFVDADKVGAVRPLYTMPIWLLLALSGLALFVSYMFVLRAIWPRHHSRDPSLKPSDRMWFFGDVASMTRDEYRILVAEWTEQDFERTMIFQNHILSRNVWIKHDALNWAIAFTILALMLLFALGMAYGIVVASAPVRTMSGVVHTSG